MPKRKRKRHQKPQAPTIPDRASNPVIHWLHALAAMGDEQWDEAIVALQHFLEMDNTPENQRTAHQNLATCYLALEHYNKAPAALDEAEGYAPDDPDIIHGRAVISACAARIPEAIASFEQLARQWPRQARQHQARKTLHQLRRIQRGEIPAGTYLVGHLQEQVGHSVELRDWHLVEYKARRMITADPDRPEGHFALGVACIEQHRYTEALEASQAAHTRDPKYEPTIYNIGHTYLQLGEPQQAIPWLERALHHEPNKLATLHQLGLACEQLGRRDEAVDWWQRALKVDPDYYQAQQHLHETSLGPEPAEPPLPPVHQQLQVMTPIVKARMRQPRVYRNGDLTLTCDDQVGFVLENSENPRNGTIQAGNPFQVARIMDEDLLDLIGLVKPLLRMINVENTRDVAVLIYYTDRPVFVYQARFERGKQVEFDADGQFVVTEVPRFFKLRIDSDLSTPYGDPMQGMPIYLNQHPQRGILVSTLAMGAK
jgi:tetratricopeptide (TPR) repeat protein